MTLVSLFAGVGGFDLGFERAGFKTIGQCEIDPHATSVLQKHWPNTLKHDDVTTLDGMHFGPADVVTFGSPCQDLSVAGKRAGLDGERSGLFLEAVRFIREMLEETNGQYPRAAVWENVSGAFSSTAGADFAAVLALLVGGEVRRPPDGWANAGVAFGPLGSAEWRVLDSQHFGVAQRRRRVFLVYHPGGERAGQVLFEPQGVPGHTAPRVEAREGATRGVEGGAGGSRPAWGFSGEFNAALEVQPTLQHDSPTGGGQKPMVGVPVDLAPTVTASWGHHGYSSPRGDGTDPIVPVASALTAREGKGPDSDATTTLIPVPVAFALRGREDGATPEVSGDRTNALRGAGGGSSRDYVTYPINDGRPMEKRQNGLGIGGPTDPSYTLTTTGAQSVAVAFAENSRNELRLEGGDGQVTGALSTGGGKPGQGTPTVAFAAPELAEALTVGANQTTGFNREAVATPYAVRRLTPKECCRLQGFPDEWTRYAADGSEIADTHRYRMMGNAVSVPVAEWIARRLKEALS